MNGMKTVLYRYFSVPYNKLLALFLFIASNFELASVFYGINQFQYFLASQVSDAAFVDNDNYSITFCTLPTNISKDSSFHLKLLAFRSWLMAFPSAEILLLGDRSLYDPNNVFLNALKAEFPLSRLRTYPVSLGFDGRPYIKSWFQNGVKLSTSKFIMMINNDIIIKRSFKKRFKVIIDNYNKLPNKKENPLFVGDRVESSLIKPIDHPLQYEELKDYILPKKYMVYGCDYFLFLSKYPPFNFSEFPPYVAGIYKWDNHFLCLSHKSTNVIALNPFIDVFHVNHYRRRDHPDNQTRQFIRQTNLMYKNARCRRGVEIRRAHYKADNSGNLKKGALVKSLGYSFDD